MNKILKKAIEKAVVGGWDGSSDAQHTADRAIERYDGYKNVYDIIFNHDFAKALWGDDPRRYYDQYEPADEAGQIMLDNWEYHLQQMVIADDPIEYLGENL